MRTTALKTNYRWYGQPQLPLRPRPDYRRFPALVRGNCLNCKRRRRVGGSLIYQVCREMLDSPMMGHMPDAEGWPEERAGPG